MLAKKYDRQLTLAVKQSPPRPALGLGIDR